MVLRTVRKHASLYTPVIDPSTPVICVSSLVLVVIPALLSVAVACLANVGGASVVTASPLSTKSDSSTSPLISASISG